VATLWHLHVHYAAIPSRKYPEVLKSTLDAPRRRWLITSLPHSVYGGLNHFLLVCSGDRSFQEYGRPEYGHDRFIPCAAGR
jgi:hypothetical protein